MTQRGDGRFHVAIGISVNVGRHADVQRLSLIPMITVRQCAARSVDAAGDRDEPARERVAPELHDDGDLHPVWHTRRFPDQIVTLTSEQDVSCTHCRLEDAAGVVAG